MEEFIDYDAKGPNIVFIGKFELQRLRTQIMRRPNQLFIMRRQVQVINSLLLLLQQKPLITNFGCAKIHNPHLQVLAHNNILRLS